MFLYLLCSRVTSIPFKSKHFSVQKYICNWGNLEKLQLLRVNPKSGRIDDFEQENNPKNQSQKEIDFHATPSVVFFQKTSRLRLAEKTVPGLSYVFFLWQPTFI